MVSARARERSLQLALSRAHRGITVSRDPSLGAAVHWKQANLLPIHRWFPYREGFSPSLLDRFHAAGARLDPFCGCGTTLVHGFLRGKKAYGVDVSPFATFLAETKTRAYTSAHAKQFTKVALECGGLHKRAPAASPPNDDLIPKLFTDPALLALMQIKHRVDQVKEDSVACLLKLAWLAILEPASNAFKEGNGLKYRNKIRRPGRYDTLPDRIWIPKYFGPDIREFVFNQWNRKCAEIADDLGLVRGKGLREPTVRAMSSLEHSSLDFGVQFGLAVFSPPYANRFDYFEAYKVELRMGGFVSSPADMAALRRKSMRSSLAAPRSASEPWEPVEEFLRLFDPAASSVRMGIEGTVRGYFADLRRLLSGLKKVLTPDAQVIIVIGNSAYAKTIVPTDALAARVAMEEGFKVQEVCVARDLHVSSQQRPSLVRFSQYMRESVLILRNS